MFRTSVSGADEDVRKLADTVPEPVATILILASQYVGAVAAIAIVAALIYIRRIRVTLAVIAAGAIGALAMLGVSTLLALDVILPAELGQLRGVSYSGVQLLAAGAAILTVLIVWIDPRWRRALSVPIAVTAFARIASGAETPYDVAIAVMLGGSSGRSSCWRAARPTGARAASSWCGRCTPWGYPWSTSPTGATGPAARSSSTPANRRGRANRRLGATHGRLRATHR